MRVKTSELQGAALDWAVLKVLIMEPVFYVEEDGSVLYRETDGSDDWVQYKPSTDWSQGGPIIEREEINIHKLEQTLPDAAAPHPACWGSHIDGAGTQYGPTPLIAGMRCYVASKLGDEIDVPEERS